MNTTVEKNALVVSACQHKGGIGKSTLSLLMAEVLAMRGFKVLLIDLDEQCNSSSTIATKPLNQFENNIKTLVQDFAKESIKHNHDLDFVFNIEHGIYGGENSTLENVDFIPGSDLDLNKPFDSVCNELSTYSNEIIQTMIKSVVKKYDFILFDCPPALDNLTRNALVASQRFISPISGTFSLDGLISLEKEVAKIYRLNNKLGLLAVVMNMFDERLIVHKATLEDALEIVKNGILGRNLFTESVITIPTSTSISKSQFSKTPLFSSNNGKSIWKPNSTTIDAINSLADIYQNAHNELN